VRLEVTINLRGVDGATSKSARRCRHMAAPGKARKRRLVATPLSRVYCYNFVSIIGPNRARIARNSGYCCTRCSVVCLLVTTVSRAKTVEPIEMQFGGRRESRGPNELCIRWGPWSPNGNGHFMGYTVYDIPDTAWTVNPSSLGACRMQPIHAAGASHRGDAGSRYR